MKINNNYIACLLGLTLIFTACDKIEPEFFDGNYNGAYFDYQSAADFEKTLNFGEYIIGNPQEVPLTLNVKLLGYLTDEARTLSIKTKEVEDYPLAEVAVPEVVFKDKEYEKGVDIIVKRPEVEDEIFAVCIYLDGEGDLGAGINGKEEFTIYVKEVHEKPSVWSGLIQTYLGDWNREKHAFLANLTNDDYYYNALYDTNLGQVKGTETIQLNELVINTLLTEEQEEPITVNFPILNADERANYNEPYFWNEYAEELGWYSSNKLCRLAHALKAANTTDISAGYYSEEAAGVREDLVKDFHKEDVLTMLDAYYHYPKQGYTIDQYKELLWEKIEYDTPYIKENTSQGNKKDYLRIPYWWEDPDNLGTAAIVKMYYGEYSHEKYQLMIKTVLNEIDGEEDFVAASILPFTITGDGYGWDETVGGEARFKECYKKIKNKRKAKELGINTEIEVD